MIKQARVENLTPHAVKVILGETAITFPPTGTVARVAAVRRNVGGLDLVRNGIPEIPVCVVEYGEVQGLPDEMPGVFLIVSALVRQALPSRRDLLSPGELVRDENGQPVGCTGFDANII